MTIMLSIEREPDFLTQLLGDYGNRVPVRAYGGGVKAEKEAENQNFGFSQGVLFALQRYADFERIKYMREYGIEPVSYGKFVKAVDDGEVREFLNWFMEDWKNPDRADKFSESEFWEIVGERFQMVVINQELKEHIEEERRKQVKAGTREPELRDEEWLVEESEVFNAMARPVDAALAKLREKQRELADTSGN